MNTPDDLSQYYAELLEGATIEWIADRIVLNALFPMETDRRRHAQLMAKPKGDEDGRDILSPPAKAPPVECASFATD
jgi:hypothetical protein